MRQVIRRACFTDATAGEVSPGVRRVCRQGRPGALAEGLAIQAITLSYLKCNYIFMFAMFLSKIIVFV